MDFNSYDIKRMYRESSPIDDFDGTEIDLQYMAEVEVESKRYCVYYDEETQAYYKKRSN